MTITQAGKLLGLSPDTLRYYERIGLIPAVARTAGGLRNYSEEDCKRIECVKCMRCAGLPIEIIIEYIALCQRGNSTISARKALLDKQRRQIKEKIDKLQKNLDLLEKKINQYEHSISNCKSSEWNRC